MIFIINGNIGIIGRDGRIEKNIVNPIKKAKGVFVQIYLTPIVKLEKVKRCNDKYADLITSTKISVRYKYLLL